MPDFNSYYQSIRFVNSLLRFNEETSASTIINNQNYDGLQGECPPVKIIVPQKPDGRVLILYPGASPYAEEHPKILILGTLLAQIGFTVYIPRIPPLKNLDISEVNVGWFIHFYQWLLDVKKVEAQQTAMVGISYGGGLMLKALLKIKEQSPMPKTIMTYGTFSDAESTIKFLLTGEISDKGKTFCITPNEWGLIVIFQNFLKNLDLEWDTAGVQNVIQLHIQGKFDEQQQQMAGLPPEQNEIAQSIISGKASPAVKELAWEIISNEQDPLKKLSPKQWCNEISQKIFILHGANDSMIPFTESIQLAEYLTDNELLISHLYEHKEISTKKGRIFNANEVMKLIQFYAKFFSHNEN